VEERLDASVKLVGALETFQAQHAPSPTSGETTGQEDAEDEEEDAEAHPNNGNDALNRRNAPDVAYAIRRLVRGLASPRESSRLGFAVALTEVCLYSIH
jgi:DNA polymerase phi